MTTDITELAQRMKAAAVRAKAATEDYVAHHMSITVYLEECKEFNDLSDGPDNILALVEALEKAQQRNGELEIYSKTAIEFREAARDENRHLKLELEIAEKRIAELESRTVKLPEPFKLAKSSSGLTYYYADEVDAALTAAGIKWEAE
ncbi:hypothetical protein [Klebsiella michiganensis]|uniref:hypothetical protein n=1 Tax=Klebsiella michiganensis TaxID=1134687 RepID=UPI001CCF3F73|nr:hypothetical protein [Klebsiella michiganensis]MBZ7607052.1 hypothetical protein [Klebsiella michiganensis]HBM2915244.1 hypothetical protein [Klebsiella michiganensis]HBM3004234.1 hypothetical protein [Klebsiella michiganensis]